MKFVTVIFAAFAYICSSSLSVGAQICTLKELQSKYNQTSFYDLLDEFGGKGKQVNQFNCTTGKKIGTIDIEAQGNKWFLSSSDENFETYYCENKEAFKGLTLAEFLEDNHSIESSDRDIISGCLIVILAISLGCNCPTQAQCDLYNASLTCEDLNTNDTSEEDENLSVGAIVGIAVGSFVFLVGVILLVYRYRKGKWPWQSSEEAEVGLMMVVKNLIF